MSNFTDSLPLDNRYNYASDIVIAKSYYKRFNSMLIGTNSYELYNRPVKIYFLFIILKYLRLKRSVNAQKQHVTLLSKERMSKTSTRKIHNQSERRIHVMLKKMTCTFSLGRLAEHSTYNRQDVMSLFYSI